jgi:hypothetical protein
MVSESDCEHSVKETAVRLWILCLFLSGAVVLQRSFRPSQPALLIPMGILTAGIIGYSFWSLWQLWSRNEKMKQK